MLCEERGRNREFPTPITLFCHIFTKSSPSLSPIGRFMSKSPILVNSEHLRRFTGFGGARLFTPDRTPQRTAHQRLKYDFGENLASRLDSPPFNALVAPALRCEFQRLKHEAAECAERNGLFDNGEISSFVVFAR